MHVKSICSLIIFFPQIHVDDLPAWYYTCNSSTCDCSQYRKKYNASREYFGRRIKVYDSLIGIHSNNPLTYISKRTKSYLWSHIQESIIPSIIYAQNVNERCAPNMHCISTTWNHDLTFETFFKNPTEYAIIQWKVINNY